jgi:uncharacterized phage protein (TIGR02218 family)
MPLRSISTDFQDMLDGRLQTLALCVKLTRLDGTVMGFTSHDRSIKLVEDDDSEVTYEANSSVEPSAVRSETGVGVDNLEVVGLLRSASISEDDILRGIYDGAALEVFFVNWRDHTQGRIVLMTGVIGEVSMRTGAFTAEVRSLSQLIQQQFGELTSSLCRVRQLGDARCKVDLAPFQETHTVDEVINGYQLRFGGDAHADDYYTYGRAVGVTGANTGYEREIKDHSQGGGGSTITLHEPFPYDVAEGDTFMLEAGCDRKFSTCKNKFDNVVNFRGEPHVPGNGKMLKFGRHKTTRVS